MQRMYLKPCLLIAISAIILSACSKDETEPTKGKTSAVFNPSITYGNMTDQDGNIYKTVTIGTQTWMAENLRTTIYIDSTAIPKISDNTAWTALTTGAYSNYNNTENADVIATYGCLYNWFAVNTGKLAPKGWHLPSDAEWSELAEYLGGVSISGGKLKETGTKHWISPNTEATNETGFTALPGGGRRSNGLFDEVGGSGYWWSTTEGGTDYAWYWCMTNGYGGMLRLTYDKEGGFSIRCVKD